MKPIKMMLGITLAAATASTAQAALFYRGNGMVYDSTQNITWLQNASMSGDKTASEATLWAAALQHGGYTDWRLPSAKLVGGNEDSCPTHNGVCDAGWNNTRSELGHLFYVDLGNIGIYDTNGNPNPALPVKTAFNDGATGNPFNFLNVEGGYWESESRGGVAPWDPELRWTFYFTSNGTQLGSHFPVVAQASGGAWAVRDGDVTPTIPVPAAAWLFGSGLMGLLGLKRRR